MIEDKQPLPDNLIDLQELCDKLWERYTTGERSVKKEYNEAATAANKLAGRKMLSLINSTTLLKTKNTEIMATKKKAAPKKKAVTKKTVKKAAPAKKVAVKKTVKAETSDKITKKDQIVALFKTGKTIQEIIDLGFNKNTVEGRVKDHRKNLREKEGK